MVLLICDILFAIACCSIANEKGRSSIIWLILGFLFGIIALFIIACLPNKKE